jgi:hypothetical protein
MIFIGGAVGSVVLGVIYGNVAPHPERPTKNLEITSPLILKQRLKVLSRYTLREK